jgi:hypothetical protein
MKLLSEINITQQKQHSVIQLLQGDLSAIPAEHATDILVMSAFPGDYIALKGSLILALEQKGLSVAALAANKETDLTKQLDCWLSKPIELAQQQQLHIKRILCYEPGDKIKEPAEVVGDIFRCINTFAFNEENNVVAMPIIATGYQQVPLQKILPAVLEAAYFWLHNGLPLKCIKLVVHSDERASEALLIFNQFKKEIAEVEMLRKGEQENTSSLWKKIKNRFSKKEGLPKINEQPAAAATTKNYDYFLSYAHVHAKEIQHFVDELKKKNSKLNIFYDKESIPPGGLWIKQISAAIQKADKVLIFLSPAYDNSMVCWDEFQCAKLMEYNRKKSVIQTIYLYGYKETEMPPIMGIYSYIDCREGSPEKLTACIENLLP